MPGHASAPCLSLLLLSAVLAQLGPPLSRDTLSEATIGCQPSGRFDHLAYLSIMSIHPSTILSPVSLCVKPTSYLPSIFLPRPSSNSPLSIIYHSLMLNLT